jgi:hypothetical protein
MKKAMITGGGAKADKWEDEDSKIKMEEKE